MTSLTSKSIEGLVFDLGIDPSDYPASFTECFNVSTPEERKALTGASGGFSRMLWGIIETIPNIEALSVEQIRGIVLNTKDSKITKSSLFKRMPQIVSDGFNRAIGFQIIRKHSAAKKSQVLMIIREQIEANAALTKAGAKGAHKGEATEEIMDAIVDGTRAYTILAQLERGMLIDYVAKRMALDDDPQAKKVLNHVYKERELLDFKMIALPAPALNE
jgi:hypothetical protein